jgi:hypothetical protein
MSAMAIFHRSMLGQLFRLDAGLYGSTWNCTLLESVPLGNFTCTVPVVASEGTSATTSVFARMLK